MDHVEVQTYEDASKQIYADDSEVAKIIPIIQVDHTSSYGNDLDKKDNVYAKMVEVATSI